MLINFETKISKRDFERLCPHPKETHEVLTKDWFEFNVICNTCIYVANIRGGKLLSVKTFINNLSVVISKDSTTIRSLDKKYYKWVPQSLINKDGFDLTNFNALVCRRMVLI